MAGDQALRAASATRRDGTPLGGEVDFIEAFAIEDFQRAAGMKAVSSRSMPRNCPSLRGRRRRGTGGADAQRVPRAFSGPYSPLQTLGPRTKGAGMVGILGRQELAGADLAGEHLQHLRADAIDQRPPQAAIGPDLGIAPDARVMATTLGRLANARASSSDKRRALVGRPDGEPPVLVLPGRMPMTLVPNWLNSASTKR